MEIREKNSDYLIDFFNQSLTRPFWQSLCLTSKSRRWVRMEKHTSYLDRAQEHCRTEEYVCWINLFCRMCKYVTRREREKRATDRVTLMSRWFALEIRTGKKRNPYSDDNWRRVLLINRGKIFYFTVLTTGFSLLISLVFVEKHALKKNNYQMKSWWSRRYSSSSTRKRV